MLNLVSSESTMTFKKLSFIKVWTFLEKHKICKNLPYGFDKSADLLSKRQNHKADFFKLCVLFKKSELYQHEFLMKPLRFSLASYNQHLLIRDYYL